MTTTTAPVAATTESSGQPARNKHPVRPARMVLHAFLVVVSLGWLAPLLLAVYASLRPYNETAKYGYFSLPHSLSFHYYRFAWDNADLPRYFGNTMFIAVPAVVGALFF